MWFAKTKRMHVTVEYVIASAEAAATANCEALLAAADDPILAAMHTTVNKMAAKMRVADQKAST